MALLLTSHLKEPPMIQLTRKRALSSVQISSSGERLLLLRPVDGVYNLFVRDLSSGVETQMTFRTQRDVSGPKWVDDQRVIYLCDDIVPDLHQLYMLQLDSGVESLIAGDSKALVVQPTVNRVGDELLVRYFCNDTDPTCFNAYGYLPNSGTTEVLLENRLGFQGFEVDLETGATAGIVLDGGMSDLYYRSGSDQPFQKLLSFSHTDSFTPRQFLTSSQSYALTNLGSNTVRLVVYDYEKRCVVEEVCEHPLYDLDGFIVGANLDLLACSYEGVDAEYQFINDDFRRQAERVDDESGARSVVHQSASVDGCRRIFRAYDDTHPGVYYLVEQREGSEILCQEIGEEYPSLSANDLFQMESIEYMARDGLRVPGYLTLPSPRSQAPFPLVIVPHGGPEVRDERTCDPLVQSLATGGYAVLQPNFRGSTGYGRKHWMAHFKEWGKAMQDDLTDGVNWAIEQGLATRNNVAILGASYGGYAATSGLCFSPEVYRCAVSIAGPSSLLTFLDGFPPYWVGLRQQFYEKIGNPETEQDLLRAASPLYHVENIVAPLLIIQNSSDPRVPQREGDQLVEAMRERRLPVEYIVLEAEGHNPQSESSWETIVRASLEFLDRHMERSGVALS